MNRLIFDKGRPLLVGGRPLLVVLGEQGEGEMPVPGGTLTLVLDDFKAGHTLAKPVLQRRAGTETHPSGGLVDAPVLFRFTGEAPAVVEARIIGENGAVIVDWKPLARVTISETPDDALGLGYLEDAPIGCEYLTQIRDASQPNNQATLSTGTRRWGVGVCVLAEGQSNMVGTLSAGLPDYAPYNALVPGTSITELAYWSRPEAAGSLWGVGSFYIPPAIGGSGQTSPGAGNVPGPAGGVLTFVRMLAMALKQKHGKKVPVCLIPLAYNSNPLSNFLAPSGANYVRLFDGSGTTGTTIGLKSPRNYHPGEFEIVLLHQGEANHNQTRAARTAGLIKYCEDRFAYVAQYGRTKAQLAILPAMLGVYNVGSDTPTGVEKLRGAVLDLWAHAKANGWARVRPGWSCLDCEPPTTNYLHFELEGKLLSHRRMTQAAVYQVMPERTKSTGLGPRLTGAVTRAGDVITLAVDHDGGTVLAPKNGAGPVTGWYANTDADFSGTDIALTNVTAVPGGVQVTAPGAPAIFFIKHCGGLAGTVQSYHSDVSNLLYDDVEYPWCDNGSGGNLFTGTDVRKGQPLLPTPDAIKVGA